MAQKVNIVLVDDIDGSDATETVSFGLDGTSYEIDLNDKNASALRDALAGYVGHARKVGPASRRGRKSAASAASSALAASSTAALSISAITTAAPSSAISLLVAPPIAPPAPVTMATFPSRFPLQVIPNWLYRQPVLLP